MASGFFPAIRRALRERAIGHTLYARTVISLFIVAVLLNYVWELAQAPLYVGLERYTAAVLWHCFIASLGDGIMVMLIFAAGWITLQRWDWFERPGCCQIFANASCRFDACGVG
jgi:hypothetical protein